MTRRHAIRLTLLVALLVARPSLTCAQDAGSTIALTVNAGRPLEILIDQRISIKRVDQPVSGILVEPLYAYDRIVVAAGTTVVGRVASLDPESKVARTRAILSGDLTPLRQIVLEFDGLVVDGRTVPIQTRVLRQIPHLTRSSAPESETSRESGGLAGRAEREAKNRVKASVAAAKQNGRDILSEITRPGRTERLKHEIVARLPYHPQIIDAGTGYEAELLAPIDFGHVAPTEAAPADDRPTPASILHARLVTPLDSAKTPRGTELQAIVTEPVFSADRRLILPEGTTLEGEVTFATPARRFHRNGQLRFLIERVNVPARQTEPLLASLQSVQASGDDRLQLDDEGGAKMTNSKTRFVAPALALLALRSTLDSHEHLDPDGDGHMIRENDPGAVGVGGFFGLGLLGIPLAHVAPPVGIGLSIFGAAKTVYANILARGREMRFPANTVIQLQLAPGPSAGGR